MAADRCINREIGEEIDLHFNQVDMRRQRYDEFGLAGLDDLERRGRPCVSDHDDVQLLVKLVTEEPPDGTTRWTMEAPARQKAAHGVPISASQCWRICSALDLKPSQAQVWMTSHEPDFWKEAGHVYGLCLNPPENAVVWSVDEKSGIHVKSRINPTKPAVPGVRSRREFEYHRHGTAMLVAGLAVHDGQVAGLVAGSTKSENFVSFLGDLVAQTPEGLDLHCIVDNLKARDTDLVHDFPVKYPQVHLHFTPTHASWLNQGKLFFSILERRLLRRGELDSVGHLAERVIAFNKDYNRRAASFRWTYDSRPLRAA